MVKPVILYQDAELTVVNKPAAWPVQPDKTGDKSLLEWANQARRLKHHPAHRLDRPVSGLVLLATHPQAMELISAQWREGRVQKTYWAIVEALPEAPQGELVHFIQKNGRLNRSFASLTDSPGAEQARLKYRVLASGDRYHLLEIELLTGRHHQIRAQLSAIGCPIKGDVKYGARRNNQDRSIHLHARHLSFEHPHTRERMTFTADLPEDNLWKSLEAINAGNTDNAD